MNGTMGWSCTVRQVREESPGEDKNCNCYVRPAIAPQYARMLGHLRASYGKGVAYHRNPIISSAVQGNARHHGDS